MYRIVFVLLMLCPCIVQAADLYVGGAICDITPDQPILLSGQFNPRVSNGVQYPIQANIVALESREGDKRLDSAVIISFDLVYPHPNLQKPLVAEIVKAVPDFDASKLIVCGTHTHASAVMVDEQFPPQNKGEMKPSDYNSWAAKKVAQSVKQAWESRKKGKFSFGMDYAVVGLNRRAVYEDGSAVMYGPTNTPRFRAVEGMEDHDVNSLFFWDESDKLIAAIINVSCPSQEVENLSVISSDYWGPTRIALRQKHGEDVAILAMCGAAGDQSPHLRYMQQAVRRMDGLRKLDRLQELARRIVNAVESTYEVVQNDKQASPTLKHETKILTLPRRIPTEAEYNNCKSEYEKRKGNPNDGQARWNKRIVDMYESLKDNPNPTYDTSINVLRIGDCVICTNQFELYTDFAIQMKARSKATQTIVVQLAAGAGKPSETEKTDDGKPFPWTFLAKSGTYLPSERAVKGGGYGAVIQSNTVGPEGGQIIVEETLKMIDGMF